jgi:CubicO group peptidase (beta-lactamase class C family)
VVNKVFPGEEWETGEAGGLGFDAQKLAAVGRWQAEAAGEEPYRLLVVRHGRIAAEWNAGVERDERRYQASAWKSTLSCGLGIAIEEGRIGSADDRVVDYYPELMDVPEGAGPKAGRWAFPENREITFRQLIGNTSGYMKPGESPGEKFHYQTFGMNILSHAIAEKYDVYKTANPEAGPGFGSLVDGWIREPIGGTWTWRYQNFAMPETARRGVFGYATIFECTARDMARLGLLWLNEGAWDGKQIVPAEWLREATRVSEMVKASEPPGEWRYGLGFWCNDQGRCWPELPRDSFAALGAGYQVIWVCPGEDLIVVQSPGAPMKSEFAAEDYGEAAGKVLAALAG